MRFCSFALALHLLSACASNKPEALKGAEFYFDEGMKAFEKKRCLEAQEHFQHLVSNFPGFSRVADAQYYLAESYFCSRDWVNAAFEYQRLTDAYPSSPWADEAQFKVGESYFMQLRRPELDQKETYEALNHFRRFVEDHPDSPLIEQATERIEQCRHRLAHKQYLSGRLYHRQGYLEAARLTYQELLRTFPETSWYYDTLLRLGEIARTQGDTQRARAYWEEVLEDSDDKQLAEEARQRLAELSAAPQG
jgi:outer membrane protein assembly factor BamD